MTHCNLKLLEGSLSLIRPNKGVFLQEGSEWGSYLSIMLYELPIVSVKPRKPFKALTDVGAGQDTRATSFLGSVLTPYPEMM